MTTFDVLQLVVGYKQDEDGIVYQAHLWHANAVLCIKKNKLCCVHLNRVAKTVHRDGNLAYRDVCLIDRVATITYRDVNFICRDVSCIFRDANIIRRDVSK